MPKHGYALRRELRGIAAAGKYPHSKDWFHEHKAHLFRSTERLHVEWTRRVLDWLRRYRGSPVPVHHRSRA
jgi:hypothetical protein